MSTYNGNSAGPFNNAYTIVDTTDTWLGGSTGIANRGPKQHMDNEAFLYRLSGGFEAGVTMSNAGPISSATLTAANLLRNVVSLYMAVDAAFTVELPTLASGGSLVRAVIRREYSALSIKPVKLAAHTGEKIRDVNGVLVNYVYLHNCECVVLYNAGSSWIMADFMGNYSTVADQMLGYYQKPGTLIRDGGNWNREDYPRLWELVSALSIAGSSLLVTEATWNSDPAGTGVYPYKSCFSTGNGTTTFRVPDDRGIFDRAMTYGAGRDADRVTAGTGSNVGDLQTDQIKSHAHSYNIPTGGSGAGPMIYGAGNSAGAVTTANGGTETRPVNVAKMPLIVY